MTVKLPSGEFVEFVDDLFVPAYSLVDLGTPVICGITVPERVKFVPLGGYPRSVQVRRAAGGVVDKLVKRRSYLRGSPRHDIVAKCQYTPAALIKLLRLTEMRRVIHPLVHYLMLAALVYQRITRYYLTYPRKVFITVIPAEYPVCPFAHIFRRVVRLTRAVLFDIARKLHYIGYFQLLRYKVSHVHYPYIPHAVVVGGSKLVEYPREICRAYPFV